MPPRFHPRRLAPLAGIGWLCAVAGCGASGGEGTSPPSPAGAPTSGEASATAAGREDLAELERLYRARQAEALARVHEADVDFVTGMISHHAQALVMSALAPDAGASGSIRTLAARIINAQRDEIANMQRWLRERDLPVPVVSGDGTMAMDHGSHHAMMPGMLTPAQLDELASARGPAFDRLFLTFMIQHHQGAVSMVQDLFATDGAAQDDFIFKIASDIQVDQITEINRMQLMLDALPPGG
ncbi:MAG: DUF305 domain-containing protein [Gemmatimonadales bacterium]|nr:MAG: DUF305 domain-containing protein [Gemmatimonadales bacterium]